MRSSLWRTACSAAALAIGGTIADVGVATGASGSFSGFGGATTGGAGRAVFVVTSLADRGGGSVRDALARAADAGGGIVRFAVGGDVVLASGLSVPANTTLDGTGAPAPGITFWGDHVASGGGVVNVYHSNVIVRGLRIRNGGNDGIQIAPKAGGAISGIVIDHCSVTNSADGGIDVTGRNGLTVSDVTLCWNYLAGNGGGCWKGTCGGGSLIKYGVTRISVHANFWDKNLRRNPSIDGGKITDGSLADIRDNVVEGYLQNGVQVVNGARANVIGNYIDGGKPAWFPSSYVYAAQNVMHGPAGTQLTPWDVMAPMGAVARQTVVAQAGAQPRDDIDAFYIDAVQTYAELKAAGVDPGEGPPAGGPVPTATPTPTAGGPVPTATAPPASAFPLPALPGHRLTDAEMYQARALYKQADGERKDKAFAVAETDYIALIRLLQGGTGSFLKESHRIMAKAEHDLAGMDRWRFKRIPEALQHSRASIAHCALGGLDAVKLGSVGQMQEIETYLPQHKQPIPAWAPPAY